MLCIWKCSENSSNELIVIARKVAVIWRNQREVRKDPTVFSIQELRGKPLQMWPLRAKILNKKGWKKFDGRRWWFLCSVKQWLSCTLPLFNTKWKLIIKKKVRWSVPSNILPTSQEPSFLERAELALIGGKRIHWPISCAQIHLSLSYKCLYSWCEKKSSLDEIKSKFSDFLHHFFGSLTILKQNMGKIWIHSNTQKLWRLQICCLFFCLTL